MKQIVLLAWIATLFVYKASAQKVIKARNAYKYIGKEVTVKDKFRISGNSSYFQFAIFDLGPDTAHIQLIVIVQGELYSHSRFGRINNKDKVIEMTGIIYKDASGHLYMNTTQ